MLRTRSSGERECAGHTVCHNVPTDTPRQPVTPPVSLSLPHTLKRMSSSLQAEHSTGSEAFIVLITLPVRLATAWHEGHTT
jgi:hypothetical protein